MLNNSPAPATKGDSETLQSKYSRLGLEYKKLREKHLILKQALLEERDQHKLLQNKHRDLEIRQRQFDQERESLQFRNEHLTKQVEYLQMQLESERRRGSKKKSNFPATTENSTDDLKTLLQEELQNKIEECSRLHTKFADITSDNLKMQSSLTEKIASLERQLMDKHEESCQLEKQHILKIQNVNDAKSALEVKVIFLEREMRQLEENLKSHHFDKNPFMDSSNYSHNAVNDLREYSTVSDTELTDFHSSIVTKLKECISTWNSVLQILERDNDKDSICSRWRESAQCILSKVEDLNICASSPLGVQWSIDSVNALNRALNDFCVVGGELFIPLLQSEFDREVASLPNVSQLRTKNADILDGFKKILEIVRQIHTILDVDSIQATSTFGENADGIVNLVNQMGVAIKDIVCKLKSKLSTLENFEAVKENQASQYADMVNGLNKLRENCGEMETILRSKCVIFQCSLAFVKLSKSSLNGLHTPSSHGSQTPSMRSGIMSPSLTEFVSPSKRHTVDVYYHEGNTSSNTSNILKNDEECSVYSLGSDPGGIGRTISYVNNNADKRISFLLTRLNTLESRIMEQSVRAQIAEQKLKSEIEMRERLEKNLLAHGGVLSDDQSTPTVSSMTYSTASYAAMSDKESLRENLLKQSYDNYCQELNMRLGEVESELMHYQDEAANLQARIKIEETERQKSARKIEELHSTICKLNEDLECTRENYTDKLSGLYDHIASLSKQLSDQDRVMDQYKAQVSRKGLFSNMKK